MRTKTVAESYNRRLKQMLTPVHRLLHILLICSFFSFCVFYNFIYTHDIYPLLCIHTSQIIRNALLEIKIMEAPLLKVDAVEEIVESLVGDKKVGVSFRVEAFPRPIFRLIMRPKQGIHYFIIYIYS